MKYLRPEIVRDIFTPFVKQYTAYPRAIDLLKQIQSILSTFQFGFHPSDEGQRYLILRFETPLMMKGSSYYSELDSCNRIIRIVGEVISEVRRKCSVPELNAFIENKNVLDHTADCFLSFFQRNLGLCRRDTPISPPSLSTLCVNKLRSLKRDQLHILPLKTFSGYNLYSFSYQNFMRQQNAPSVNFCSHPMPHMNYNEVIPFTMVLDLRLYAAFTMVEMADQKRKVSWRKIHSKMFPSAFHEECLDKEIGLDDSYCFITFEQFCRNLNITKF